MKEKYYFSLSNVFAIDLVSKNSITSIIMDAITLKKVELFTTPGFSKDYIFIDDVCKALIELAPLAKTAVYNLSSGTNTCNRDILNEIENITHAQIIYSSKAQNIIFKKVGNKKIFDEIGFKPTKNLIETLPEILTEFQKFL